MNRKFHLYASGGIFTFLVGVYTASKFKVDSQQRETHTEINEKTRLEAYKNRIVKNDLFMEWQEYLFGITSLRKKIGESSEGDVLEVASGTGRNFLFYDKKQIKSVTFTDAVAESLLIAADKCNLENMKQRRELPLEGRCVGGYKAKFMVVNTSQMEDFPSNSFDTVVDTLGLCSYEYPKVAVSEMIRVCKPGGKIIFLEHGKGTNGIVNRWLKAKSHRHLLTWGCYWDRDIENLVENEAIEVIKVQRKMFGTFFFITAIKR